MKKTFLFILVSAVILALPITAYAEYKWTEEPVMIPSSSGSYEIPAIYTYVEGASGEKFPAVVMLHGTGSNKNEAGNGYDLLAPKLAAAGIASIRFDFIGTGDSKVDYIDYNFTSALRDTADARKYLLEKESIDSGKIGIMGWSQGGTIAMLAAGNNPADYQSVVLWAGALDLSGIATEEMRAAAEKDGFAMLEFGWREPVKLGKQWMDEVAATDVLDVFSKADAATLAIAGENDDVVDPKIANEIIAKAKNPLSQVMILLKADHTFNIFSGDMSAFEQLMQATISWFQSTLIPMK